MVTDVVRIGCPKVESNTNLAPSWRMRASPGARWWQLLRIRRCAESFVCDSSPRVLSIVDHGRPVDAFSGTCRQ